MLVGALTGPIYDAGYFRVLLSVGSFLVVFGFMMLSLATKYYQVILAQAICVGLGAGCLFVPSVAILSTYFSTRIATAMGFAAAGSSLGKHSPHLHPSSRLTIHRWRNLPHRLLPPSTRHWFSLGHPCNWIHRLGHPHHLQRMHESSRSSRCPPSRLRFQSLH